MHGSIIKLVESYGYAIVFLFVAIESLGIPLPGETVLVTAGALAALGHLSIWWVIAIAAAGGITGDAAGYWIGRLGGLPLLKRYGRLVHFNDEKLARVRSFFDRHGPKTVFLGRFIALVVTLTFAWRWFNANRNALTERVARYWSLFRERHPGVAKFIAARFAREEYLGMHLTIGFLLSLVALWLFAGVTEDVVNHDSLTRFDLALTTSIRAHTTPFGDRIFTLVSLIGSPVAMAVVGVGGAIIIAVRRQWFALGAWVAAFVGAGALTFVLKMIIQRPRPIGAEAFLHGETFSFPSGHALGSLVGYGMLAWVIGSNWIETARGRWWLGVATALLIGAIGISRLYLGVHYFSDVVAGYAVGVLWLSVCVSALQVAERRRR